MAPTSALWDHPSESAASVSASLHKTASRGGDAEAPRKRRSARIAAIRKRTRETSGRGAQPQGKPRSAPAPALAQQQQQQQPERLSASPAPADTATAAEAAAAQGSRARHASLAHVMWRTLLLMHSNRLLALQVEALKRETSAFVCSVLRDPQARGLPPPQQPQHAGRSQHASS